MKQNLTRQTIHVPELTFKESWGIGDGLAE